MLGRKMKVAIGVVLVGATALLAGCASAADVTDENLDTQAENFEIQRRIVFVNTITDTYMLEVQGLCNIRPLSGRVQVTCQIGEDEFIRHAIYSGDNTAVVVEQIDPNTVSEWHYDIRFRPETILPDFSIETDANQP